MTATTRHLKLSVTMILGVAALLLLLLGGSVNKSQAATQLCSTYELLYPGKVGKVTYPKGIYSVTLEDNEKITCDYAQENFEAFLQNFYNKVNKPWVMKAETVEEVTTTTFKRGKKSKVAFSIVATLSPSRAPFDPITEAEKCKGNYVFKKARKIGSFKIPKGSYRLGPVNEKKLNCGKSKKAFNKFLKKGKFPDTWKLTKSSATWIQKENRQAGFFITRNVAAPASES